MNDTLTLLSGSLLGMLLLIAVRSYYVQVTSKYALNFANAMKVYTFKYTGPLFVGLVVTFIAMFVLPSIKQNAGGPDKYGPTLKHILMYLRIYAVALGVLAQGLGFLIIKGGDKYLRDAENKLMNPTTDDKGKLNT